MNRTISFVAIVNILAFPLIACSGDESAPHPVPFDSGAPSQEAGADSRSDAPSDAAAPDSSREDGRSGRD